MQPLPPQVRELVQNAYGDATAELFMLSVPFAVLALVAVLFVKEKALLTTSGAERMAAEQAGADVMPYRPKDGGKLEA